VEGLGCQGLTWGCGGDGEGDGCWGGTVGGEVRAGCEHWELGVSLHGCWCRFPRDVGVQSNLIELKAGTGLASALSRADVRSIAGEESHLFLTHQPSCPLHTDPALLRPTLKGLRARIEMNVHEALLPAENPAAHHPHIPAITTAAAPRDDTMMIDPRNQVVEVSGGKRSRGMRPMRGEMIEG